MKYIRPEIEIIDLEMLDVIAASGDPTDPAVPEEPKEGEDGLPIL